MPPPRFKRPAFNGHVTLRSFASRQQFTTAAIRRGELEESVGDVAHRLGLRGDERSPLCLVDETEMPLLVKLVDGGEYYVSGGSPSEVEVSATASRVRCHPDLPVAWAFDPRVLLHEPSSHRSPETPHRLIRAVEMLQQSERAHEMLPRELREDGATSGISPHNLASFIKPRMAENEEILAWHDKSVYEAFLTRGTALGKLKSDVYCNEGTSATAVKLSAAAVIDGCNAVLRSVTLARTRCGDATDCPDASAPLAALCLVRPPGHHCTASQPGGFCLINNVAVACQQVRQRRYKFDSATAPRPPTVAIIDLDVHFGEGTVEFVEAADRSAAAECNAIIYMSLHRYDQGTFYPSDARGATSYHGPSGQRCIFNVAVDTYPSDLSQCEKVISDHVMYEAVERGFIPLLDWFKPDLVIVSQGFDAAYGDPLGRMAVEGGFGRVIGRLKKWCFADTSHPIAGLLVALEGGYNPEAVSQGITSIAYALTFPEDDVNVQQTCQHRRPRTWIDARNKVERRKVEQEQLQAETELEKDASHTADSKEVELPSDEVLFDRHVQWCYTLMDVVTAEFDRTIHWCP